MSTRDKVLPFAGGVCVGMALVIIGVVSGTPRENVESISTPSPQPTVTIYKSVGPQKVEMQRPLPASCIKLPTTVTDLAANLNAIDGKAGTIKQEASDLQKYAMVSDRKALVTTIEAMSASVSEMDDAVIAKAQMVKVFDDTLAECQRDLG